MSCVISFRIPRRLKEEMDRFRNRVDWAYEIRKFIEKRIEELRRIEVLEEVRKVIEQIPESPPGTAARYVREDRESH